MSKIGVKRGVIIGLIIALVFLLWLVPIGFQLWQLDQDLAKIETEFASIDATLNQQLERLDRIHDNLGTPSPSP